MGVGVVLPQGLVVLWRVGVVEELFISKSQEHFRMMVKLAAMLNQGDLPQGEEVEAQYSWKILD